MKEKNQLTSEVDEQQTNDEINENDPLIVQKIKLRNMALEKIKEGLSKTISRNKSSDKDNVKVNE